MNRKIYALSCFLIISFSLLNAQSVVFHEDFEQPSNADSVQHYSSAPSNAWGISSSLYADGMQSDSAKCSPNDTLTITTDAFGTTSNAFVVLEFDHICKIEALDKAIIEVSGDNGLSWTKLDTNHYMGASVNFGSSGNVFNATSYGGTWKSGQTQYTPTNNWWKHEEFNISAIAANTTNVKVRFSLIDVNGATMFENYGWFIDNIMITASPSEMIPPAITLASPIVQDTITSANPQIIKAKIYDNSGIDTAFLVYSVNGIIADTLGMNNFMADSFSVSIPFQGYGREVSYFIEATDLATIANTAVSNTYNYYLKYVPGGFVSTAFTESFENGIPVSWSHSTSSTWTHHTGSTSSYGTGPDQAHHGSYYIYTEASGVYNTPHSLESAALALDTMQHPFLKFYYHMYGSYMGSLHIDVYDGNAWVQDVWSISGQQQTMGSDPWLEASVDLKPYKSSNTKIRIRGITGSSTASDMAVDYVRIGETQLPVPDAGMAEIAYPTGGVIANANFDVKARFKNFGGVNLSAVDIGWQLDGATKATYNWTGTILPDSISAELNMGTVSVAQGAHHLKLWTANPNNSVDFNLANDTMHFSFYGCVNLLSGSYTIGGANPDYTSFSDAVLALSQCGVNGPVTFNIAPGVYNEQIVIPGINGASATNNIVFQSTSNDSTAVILQYDATNSGDNYVMKLDGASHIRFEGITFKSQDMVYPKVVALSGGASNLEFVSNQFVMQQAISNGSGADSALVMTDDSVGNNISFSENYFKYGTQALILGGNDASGIHVSHNHFVNQSAGGVNIIGAVAPGMKYNVLETSSISTDFNGYQFTSARGAFEMAFNQLYADSTNVCYGIRINSSAGDSLSHGRVYNNIILGRAALGGTTLSAGILSYESRFVDYHFNTIKMIGNDQNSPAFCIYDMNTGVSKGQVISNNIFSNFANGYVFFSMSVDTSAYQSDYNNWYADGSGDFAYLNGATAADLVAFQNLTNDDAYSFELDPYFPSVLDLHTSNNLLNNTGIPVSGITTDIDGELRDASNPDIGADEFDASPYDIAIIGVESPQSECGMSSSETVTIVIKNVGSASVDTVYASYSMPDTSTSVVTESIYQTINPGDTLIYAFSQTVDLDITSHGMDSLFFFKSWVDNQHDPIPNNDSIGWQVNSKYEPPAPVVSDTTISYSNTVTLTAISNDTLYWYADDTSSVELLMGDYFSTPKLYDTTTYYVAAQPGATAPLIITEYSSNPDAVEIQNVSGAAFDATGWQVIMSTSNTDINMAVTQTWALGQLSKDQVLQGVEYTDFQGVGWVSGWNIWVMIVDDQGEIVDFAARGWSDAQIAAMNVNAGGFAGLNPVNSSQWSGAGAVATNDFNIRQNIDNDDATDWINSASGSLGQLNPGMIISGGQTSGCPSPRVPITVNVINYPQIDAGISAVVEPKGSVYSGVKHAIKVAIHNYGLNGLQSANIGYAVNGQFQNTITWSGNLAHGQTDTLVIDSAVFNGGVFALEAWSSNPNGTSDLFSGNDTSISNFNACMNGVYTIGDTSGGVYYDFLDFNDAMNAMKTADVCGPVIFKVADGNYFELLEVPEIIGVDSINTVTFTSISQDSTAVVLEGAPLTTSEGVLYFNEGDWFTFEQMTIRVAPGAAAGRAVFIEGEANHNTIRNCVIESQAGSSSSNSCIYTNGDKDEYLSILNNHLKNGYYSIYIRSASVADRTSGLQIRNNIIEDFYYYGMYIYAQDSARITGNKLYNLQGSSTNYAVYSYYSFNGTQIADNEIYIDDPQSSSSKYGMRLYYSNYYAYYNPSVEPVLVYNNMISINSSGSKYGLYAYNNNDTKFMYNSIKLDGLSSYTSRPLYQSNNANNTQGESYVNNNFVDMHSDYAAYFSDPTSVNESDFNNYYSASGNVAYWNGPQATLGMLQMTSGMDSSSMNVLPQFVSAMDLRLDGTQLAEKGTPLTEVPRDIDGKLRGLHATTIGAHEKYLVPIDAGIDDIISPVGSVNSVVDFPVSVIVKNFGTDTLYSFDVSYTLDGSNHYQVAYNQVLPPFQTDTVNFPDTLVQGGNQNICFSTHLAADTMPHNDQLCEAFYAVPEYDIGVSGLLKPDSGICYTSAEPVIVRLKNYGYKNLSLSANPVDVICEVTGPNATVFPVVTVSSGIIPVGGTRDVTISTSYDMSAGGLYTFKAHTSMAIDGDSLNNAMNDQAITVHPTISNLPYFEDFESFTPGNGSTVPGVFNGGWASDPFVMGNEYQWFVNSGSTGTSSTGPDADHTMGTTAGKYMYVESSYGGYKQQAYLVTPCIDLGQAQHPVMRFWYHMYGINTYSLRIDVNNGTGWQNSIGFLISQQQSNAGDPWEHLVVDLSQFAGDIVKIRFRAVRGPGMYADMAIDDVLIYEPSAVELSMKAVNLPDKEFSLVGNLEPVEVEVENLGLDTVKMFDIGYYAANMQPVSETWTGTLNPFQSVTVNLSSPYQVQKGKDPLKIFVSHPDDMSKSNDTAYCYITGFGTEPLPHFEDFEGQDFWLGIGTSNQWERGVPSASTINNPYSGSNVWAINLDGDYSPNSSDLLYTPYFNFANVQGATLEFKHWYDTQNPNDGGFIQYTQSFGNAWQVLGNQNDPLGTNWYNASNGAMPLWSGSSSGWETSAYDLSQFDNSASPIQFRFAFTTDATSSNFNGWAVDNFRIDLPKIPYDAGVFEIVSPKAYNNAAGSHLVVRLVNYGTSALTSVPLEYTINGGAAISETWTGNLQPGDSVLYTFSATLNPPAGASFNLCVKTLLSGDSNSFNDQACKEFGYDASVPYVMNPLLISYKQDTTQVTVMLRNEGSDTIIAMDVYYQVKNDPAVTEQWMGILAPGESVPYTFSQTFVSPGGLYQICGGSALNGDTDPMNDEVCKYVTGKQKDVAIAEHGGGSHFAVAECYPNPADDYTVIPLDLREPLKLKFELFDMTGKRLLTRGHQLPAGKNEIRLNLLSLKQGMYYYRLSAEHESASGKVVIMR